MVENAEVKKGWPPERPWLEDERTELHDGTNVLFAPEKVIARSLPDAQNQLEEFFANIQEQGGNIVAVFPVDINLYTGMSGGMSVTRNAVLVKKE